MRAITYNCCNLFYLFLVKPSTKQPEAPTKSAGQIRSPVNRLDAPIPKITSITEYQSRMKAKTENTGIVDVPSYPHFSQEITLNPFNGFASFT